MVVSVSYLLGLVLLPPGDGAGFGLHLDVDRSVVVELDDVVRLSDLLDETVGSIFGREGVVDCGHCSAFAFVDFQDAFPLRVEAEVHGVGDHDCG